MTHPQTQDDEALVRMLADAIADRRGVDPAARDDGMMVVWRMDARAALTALRNHEGRKG